MKCCFMKALIGMVLLAVPNVLAQDKALYHQDFEKEEIGKLPAGFLVLDGAFSVKEEKGNKFLELPGSPLDTFAVQFGPADADNISVSASICATAKGRRFPVFGIGLNGIAGYRLQASPAKNAIELFKDQTLKATIPYDWKSGAWLNLRLQVQRAQDGFWKVDGKVWPKGSAEPQQWMIHVDDKEQPLAGRASIFGSPFSGTPIQFDDLKVDNASRE